MLFYYSKSEDRTWVTKQELQRHCSKAIEAYESMRRFNRHANLLDRRTDEGLANNLVEAASKKQHRRSIKANKVAFAKHCKEQSQRKAFEKALDGLKSDREGSERSQVELYKELENDEKSSQVLWTFSSRNGGGFISTPSGILAKLLRGGNGYVYKARS